MAIITGWKGQYCVFIVKFESDGLQIIAFNKTVLIEAQFVFIGGTKYYSRSFSAMNT